MANDCIGAEVMECVRVLSEGEVLILENVRFYKEEEKNNTNLADKACIPC
jgi:phosphoglycerate kinase